MKQIILLVSENEYNRLSMPELYSYNILIMYDIKEVFKFALEGCPLAFTKEYVSMETTEFTMLNYIDTLKLIKDTEIIYFSPKSDYIAKQIVKNPKNRVILNDIADLDEAGINKLLKNKVKNYFGKGETLLPEDKLLLFCRETKEDKYQSINAQTMPYVKGVSNLTLTYKEENDTLKQKNTLVLNENKNMNKQIQTTTNELLTITNLYNKSKESNILLRNKLVEMKNYIDNINETVNLWQENGVYNLNPYIKTVVDTDTREQSPIVIYFKELDTIQYFNTFIVDYLKTLNDSLYLRTKLVILENGMNTKRLPIYDNVNVLSDNVDLSILLQSDMFVKFGSNKELLQYLINNTLNLDVLLVYDKTLTDNIYIQGSKAFSFYISNRLKDCFKMGIDSGRIISNLKSVPNYLPTVDNYDMLKENDMARLVLTKTPTYKLINTLIKTAKEEFSDDKQI